MKNASTSNDSNFLLSVLKCAKDANMALRPFPRSQQMTCLTVTKEIRNFQSKQTWKTPKATDYWVKTQWQRPFSLKRQVELLHYWKIRPTLFQTTQQHSTPRTRTTKWYAYFTLLAENSRWWVIFANYNNAFPQLAISQSNENKIVTVLLFPINYNREICGKTNEILKDLTNNLEL